MIRNGSFGRLNNHQSIDPIFCRSCNTISTCLDTIKFANEARLCFDRIIASPSYVIPWSRSKHKNMAALRGDMLQHATYLIMTQLGAFTNSYSHCCSSPASLWVRSQELLIASHVAPQFYHAFHVFEQQGVLQSNFNRPHWRDTFRLHMVGY